MQQLGVKSSQNNSASPIAQTVAIKNIADLYLFVKANDLVNIAPKKQQRHLNPYKAIAKSGGAVSLSK